MGLPDRFVNRLNVSDKDSRWLRWACALVAALYLVFIAIAEVGPIARYGHDTFLFLDGGWRILNGQMPYRDFNIPLGPLEYLLVTGGMLLTSASPQGIAIDCAAVGLIIGVWGWFLSSKRMPAVPALLITAWLILTSTAPTSLGFATPNFPSCAMIYNRQGYALLGLVIIECVFASKHNRFSSGLSSGIALALMAFLKLNFFGYAGLFLLASVPIRRNEMARVWGCLVGFAGVTAVFVIYLWSAIPAFIADMTLAAQARQSRSDPNHFFGGPSGRGLMVVLALLTIAAVYLMARGKLDRQFIVRMSIIGCVVIASRPYFRFTDSGETGFQLAALWAAILVAVLLTVYRESATKAAVSVVIALGLVGFVVEILPDAQSVVTLIRFSTPSVQARGFSLPGPGMQRLKFYDLPGDPSIASYDNGHYLVDNVEDGIALLEKNSAQNESVFGIGYRNPFSYVLRRKPAFGGSTLLQIDYNFSEKRPLDADQVFGDADLIMLPNYPSGIEPSNAAIVAIYRPYLQEHFVFVASSQWWSLYRRVKLEQGG